MNQQQSERKRVVILGGGFAGLSCARGLRRVNVDVTLVDRRNFHLFQPLLYQVATGGLSPANIAAPLRSILRKQKNVKVLMENVVDFEIDRKELRFQDGSSLPYDILVVCAGSTHHYFGKDSSWEPLAPGLKTIEDATEIRKRVLSAFEQAEATDDDALRRKLLTFLVIGGGPTGIELAGAICELSRQTMRHDFRSIDPSTARVILVENSPVVLERYHRTLSIKAKEALLSIGAEVWNETRLLDITSDYAVVSRGGKEERVATQTVLWAAGVKASSLGPILIQRIGESATADRGGRVMVNEFCNVPGHDEIFVIGDMANQSGKDGHPLPGVAPVAIQQGVYVAKVIRSRLAGQMTPSPFRYWDKGNMATIGRSRAVAESGSLRFSGKLAWLAWLFIHILYLARFENRVMVLFQWGWNYITRNRTARLITGVKEPPREVHSS